jgi:hypothetical protein
LSTYIILSKFSSVPKKTVKGVLKALEEKAFAMNNTLMVIHLIP